MSRLYRLEEQELAAAEALGAGRVPPEPRPAAGVILARDTAAGPEVLLVRRRADVRFAAGAHVFPGGTLDEDDGDPAWLDFLVAPEPQAIAGASGPDETSELTFVVAALRETFEETGVLLAVGPLPDADELSAGREALVAGRRRFLEIVRLAGDRLVLCARWVTPEALSRRYDARFFLEVAPEDVEVSPETGELVEHVWIAPAKALELYFDLRFRMLYPTAKTLSWLEQGSSVEEWRERFLEQEIKTTLPRLRREGDTIIAVVPGEPRYDERQADG
jgi:8-oxo-dGTP pyrophosphatase MutT (NUDIX family)